MSNKITKAQETIKQNKAKEDLQLYATLPGSIVTSIGILSGKNRKQILENFRDFKQKIKALDSEHTNVEDLTKLAYNLYGEQFERKLLSNLILCVDTRGFYTPLVSIADDSADYLTVLPLDPKGLAFGVIGMARDPEHSEFVELEWIFDENGLPYKNEDE